MTIVPSRDDDSSVNSNDDRNLIAVVVLGTAHSWSALRNNCAVFVLHTEPVILYHRAVQSLGIKQSEGGWFLVGWGESRRPFGTFATFSVVVVILKCASDDNENDDDDFAAHMCSGDNTRSSLV